MSLNPFGSPVPLTDPNNHSTHFAYNAADRLVEKIDALGNATRRHWEKTAQIPR